MKSVVIQFLIFLIVMLMLFGDIFSFHILSESKAGQTVIRIEKILN